MNKKRHNHKYPNFLIKKWKKDPWSKNENRRVKYRRQKHMGEKNYYPDELEDKLAKVEQEFSMIANKIEDGVQEFSDMEWAKIMLFVKIQAIRLDNISHFIDDPDYYFVGNNNFLFGVFTSNDKEAIIAQTNFLVEGFLNKTLEDYENHSVLTAISPVIWESDDNAFVVTDNAVFKEVDMDGRFLFIMMPISPRYAIVLSKNSYYSSRNNLQRLKNKTGDYRISMSTLDSYLINNYKHDGFTHLPFRLGKPSVIPKYNVEESKIITIINSMIQDADKLIFSDKNDEFIKKNLKTYLGARKITLW